MGALKKAVVYTIAVALVILISMPYGAGLASLAGYDHLSWLGKMLVGLPFLAALGYPSYMLWARARLGGMTVLQEYAARWLFYFVAMFVLRFGSHLPTPKDYRENAFNAVAFATLMALFTTRSLMTRSIFERRQRPSPPSVPRS